MPYCDRAQGAPLGERPIHLTMNQYIAYSRIKHFLPRYSNSEKRNVGVDNDPMLAHGVDVRNLPKYAYDALLYGIHDRLDGFCRADEFTTHTTEGAPYSEQQWYFLGREAANAIP